MSVDHRWGMRESFERNVLIHCPSQRLLHGHTCDVSISGIFVSTPVAGLNINGVVELVVSVRENGATAVYRIPAMVARVTDRGVGLTFTTLNPNEASQFLALLRADNARLIAQESGGQESGRWNTAAGTSARVRTGKAGH